jgi:hypothetical protein
VPGLQLGWKGLGLEVFLDPLDVLEHVLLDNINHMEPVHRKQLVLLFLRIQVVDGLPKLLIE